MDTITANSPHRTSPRFEMGTSVLEFFGGAIFVGALSFLLLFLSALWRERSTISLDEKLSSFSMASVLQMLPQVLAKVTPSDVSEVRAKPSFNLDQIVGTASVRYDVRPGLLYAIIAVRSDGDASLVSARGEKGLMQLMPLIVHEMKVSDPLSPEENVLAGAQYYSLMLKRYNGEEKKALAAFLAGPAWVDYYGDAPPEQDLQKSLEQILAIANQ